MSTEAKRPRGRPRKIVSGSLDVAPPSLAQMVANVAAASELKLSKAHRITIHAIAREVEISPAIVLKDVINQGVPQVREMYADLIECRRRLEQRNNGQRTERPLQKTTDLRTEGNGRVTEEFDSGLGPEPRSFDIERGHQGAGEADLAAFSSDDSVVIE